MPVAQPRDRAFSHGAPHPFLVGARDRACSDAIAALRPVTKRREKLALLVPVEILMPRFHGCGRGDRRGALPMVPGNHGGWTRIFMCRQDTLPGQAMPLVRGLRDPLVDLRSGQMIGTTSDTGQTTSNSTEMSEYAYRII